MNKPELGSWFALCCLHDLQQIKTKEQLNDILDNLKDSFGVEQMNYRFWPDFVSAFVELAEEEKDIESIGKWIEFNYIKKESE